VLYIGNYNMCGSVTVQLWDLFIFEQH